MRPTVRVSALVRLWHGLPWNTVYWLVVLMFAGGATFFAVEGERQHFASMGIEVAATATVLEGDLVTVVLILNGDEIVIEDKSGHRARLRMLAVHSFDPVVNEREITSYGDAAVRFLEEWVLGKSVLIFFDRTHKDPRGRYLGYVHVADVDVNRRMIEEGVAMVYTEFPTAREQAYLVAEQGARRTRRGIWGGKKSSRRILGLRTAWAVGRQQRDGAMPADPLLEENH